MSGDVANGYVKRVGAAIVRVCWWNGPRVEARWSCWLTRLIDGTSVPRLVMEWELGRAVTAGVIDTWPHHQHRSNSIEEQGFLVFRQSQPRFFISKMILHRAESLFHFSKSNADIGKPRQIRPPAAKTIQTSVLHGTNLFQDFQRRQEEEIASKLGI